MKEIIAFINDNKNLNNLINISNRWADEKDFEDWASYEDFMKNCCKIGSFVKATKRPFGFMINYQNQIVHIFLKNRKKYTSLCASIVK